MFTAAASGAPLPTVQWQLSTNGGGTWGNISGATTDTLKVEQSRYPRMTMSTAPCSRTPGSLETEPAELTVKEKEPEAGKHKEEKSGEPIVSPTGSKEPLGWPEEPLVSPLPAGSLASEWGQRAGRADAGSAAYPRLGESSPTGRASALGQSARVCSRASRRAAAAQTKRPSRCGKPKPKPKPKGVRKRRR